MRHTVRVRTDNKLYRVNGALYFEYVDHRAIGHVLGRSLSLSQNCPFTCWDLDPHLTRFPGSTRVHTPNGISVC